MRMSRNSRMADYATLITGPSGTGKELVARAIGLSRYLPFEARRGEFADDFSGAFFPLNLSRSPPPSSNPSCSGTVAARSPAP